MLGFNTLASLTGIYKKNFTGRVYPITLVNFTGFTDVFCHA